MKRVKNILVGVDLALGEVLVSEDLVPPTAEAVARALWLAKTNSARLFFFPLSSSVRISLCTTVRSLCHYASRHQPEVPAPLPFRVSVPLQPRRRFRAPLRRFAFGLMSLVGLLTCSGCGETPPKSEQQSKSEQSQRKSEVTTADEEEEDAPQLIEEVTKKLVLIPPGTLKMGAAEVSITRPFYLGIHEVTQEQYEG